MNHHVTPPSKYPRSASDLVSSSPPSSNQSRSALLSTPFSVITDDSPSPFSWRPVRKHNRYVRATLCQRLSPVIRWMVIGISMALAIWVWRRPLRQDTVLDDLEEPRIQPVLRPLIAPQLSSSKSVSVEKWLRANQNDGKLYERERSLSSLVTQLLGRPRLPSATRPRAAIISLVRNEELEGIMQSMRQLELHWNQRYHYPWVFFNEKPFSEEFKAATTNLTSAQTFYELIPQEHWSTPSWIDENRYMNSLDYLGAIGVGKGYMLSYRNMCRWNSGFFYKHRRLLEYDFYWRVEPDVHFFCDIDYDPFRLLRDNGLVYGFNMLILDDARSFPSLFSQTQKFVDNFPELVHPDADLTWLMDPVSGEYNNCQFFSNFEIGDLRFFRAEANEKYFDYLDKNGGFFYERFGDAPIHTLSLALFAPKNKVHFFRDIGYQHDIARHCPPGNSGSVCTCEPTVLDENFYKLVPMESPQRKPDDTCIRLFLGGDWLSKKQGWSQEAERAFGGDGFHGYERDERA